MRFFQKVFLIACLSIVLSTSYVANTYAANIFGITEKPGCESKDPFLPVLVICGRNPATGACAAYSQPCTLGDLVDTGSRALVWLISVILLIIPILIIYYGALIIVNAKTGADGGVMKAIKSKMWKVILYFILLLSGWLIVRTVVDVFQVRTDGPNPINTFLIDENGNKVQSRSFNTN